jgi:phosphatidylglycerophosphate synthase
MESIPELRKICQTAFSREQANPWGRFLRIFTIYITRFLLPRGVSANQASLLMIAAGTAGCLSFLSPFAFLFAAGALLMQLWYALDGVDGEVARDRHYDRTGSLIMDKRDGSLSGQYLDMINHYVMNFLLPSCLAFGLFAKTAQARWLLLGIPAALGQVLILAMHDARSRTQLTYLKRFAFVQVLGHSKEEAEAKPKQGERGFFHAGFVLLHQTSTYPWVINLTGLAAILNGLVPAIDWRMPLLVYFAFGSPLVTGVLIGRAVRRRLNEEEFQRDFRVSDTAEAVAGGEPSGRR